VTHIEVLACMSTSNDVRNWRRYRRSMVRRASEVTLNLEVER